MDIDTWIKIGEGAIAVLGILYGRYEYFQRHKLKETLKVLTQAYPGDVAKIYESCRWGWTNVRDAIQVIARMPDSPEKIEAIKFISSAIGDTASSERMCINLFNQLLTLQKAQFGTRELVHPQKATLALCIAEAKSQAEKMTVAE